MSVRFDNAADRLLRTADLLDMNSVYTWCAWVYLVSNLATQSTFFALNDNNVNNLDIVRTAANGVQVQLRCSIGGAGTNVGGTTLSVGTWYHVAMVRESQTSLKAYLNGVLDATATDNITGRVAAQRMEHGAIRSTNAQPSDSRVAAIKAWNTNLTAAEIAQEVQTIRPVRSANLYGFWPAFPTTAERLRDYSGNGRDWTESGMLTDEDPPPVSWGSRIIFFPFTVPAPVTPAAAGPYVGDTAIYDALGAVGSISGAALALADAMYDTAGATGSITGGTVQSSDTAYDALTATGSTSGATTLPADTTL